MKELKSLWLKVHRGGGRWLGNWSWSVVNFYFIICHFLCHKDAKTPSAHNGKLIIIVSSSGDEVVVSRTVWMVVKDLLEISNFLYSFFFLQSC